MIIQIIFVLILNFIISLIGTLAYCTRIVGVRIGKIAITFAVFNILSLVSRVAVTFQTPILTKLVEYRSSGNYLITIFDLIIIVSGIATVFAALLIPTFQKIFYKCVLCFSVDKSISKLMLYGFSKAGINYMRNSIAIPVKSNIRKINLKKVPKKLTLYNLISVSLITTGSLAPIYAGSLEPELRATCITLSSIINGLAVILMSIFIDPQLSIMTDDVIDNKCSEEDFCVCIFAMIGSKIIGTFAAIMLLIPFSYVVVYIARLI
nr:lipid II flippase Amj family protein [Clostridium sp. HBUAS56017]